MKSIMRKALLAGAMAVSSFGAVAPAHAVTFNLINTGGAEIGTQARKGFDIAAAYWSSVLTNNSTINLQIGFTGLGEGILGSTRSTREDVSLTSVVDAMAATGNSRLDDIAISTLYPKVSNGSIAAITNGPVVGNLGVDTRKLEFDRDGSENNSYIWGNTSVLKAMGLTKNEYIGGDFSNVVDGSVTFSSNFGFDFDPSNGVSAGKYDFIGVAIHEIGHALGFVSGVDLYDQYGFPNGPARGSSGFDFDNPGGGLMSTLDLFRYSNDVNNVVPGSAPVLDWSVASKATIAKGGNPYFSIDGKTQLFGDSIFSTGTYNGDGQQASHWKDEGGCTGQIGIMDPNFCSRQVGEVTASDLAAFDAMGWNIAFDVLGNPSYVATTGSIYQMFASSVPEPANWLTMIVGFGVIGGITRRQRRTVALSA